MYVAYLFLKIIKNYPKTCRLIESNNNCGVYLYYEFPNQCNFLYNYVII